MDRREARLSWATELIVRATVWKRSWVLKGKKEDVSALQHNLRKGLGFPHFWEVLPRGFQLQMVHHRGLQLGRGASSRNFSNTSSNQVTKLDKPWRFTPPIKLSWQVLRATALPTKLDFGCWAGDLPCPSLVAYSFILGSAVRNWTC